ncbi:MAG: hypothetical protein C0481_08060 [Phenylobacterium sp.]|nr:hypothetical protein [Phenylobacterium sp.]
MIIQFIPSLVIGLIWVVPVYRTCLKRRVTPWPWAIACVLPLVNLIAIPVFWVTTIMAILDRLNAEGPEKTFS